ncbi:large ribosomal subunit protein mL42-like [Branchiostoma floridae x Branchiostoma japonicum]
MVNMAAPMRSLSQIFFRRSQPLACAQRKYSTRKDDGTLCQPELAVTSDGRTIVCYHPSKPFPYEHTKPLPPLDHMSLEAGASQEDILKLTFKEQTEEHLSGPDNKKLEQMFFIHENRWWGSSKVRLRKSNEPKDRETELWQPPKDQ